MAFGLKGPQPTHKKCSASRRALLFPYHKPVTFPPLSLLERPGSHAFSIFLRMLRFRRCPAQTSDGSANASKTR